MTNLKSVLCKERKKKLSVSHKQKKSPPPLLFPFGFGLAPQPPRSSSGSWRPYPGRGAGLGHPSRPLPGRGGGRAGQAPDKGASSCEGAGCRRRKLRSRCRLRARARRRGGESQAGRPAPLGKPLRKLRACSACTPSAAPPRLSLRPHSPDNCWWPGIPSTAPETRSEGGEVCVRGQREQTAWRSAAALFASRPSPNEGKLAAEPNAGEAAGGGRAAGSAL